MKKFIIKDVIKQNAPDFKGLIISADIENTQYNQEFWDRFDLQIKEFADNHKVEDINKIKTINATRNVYKSLGKEPNRYRPSAEALCRRIIKEKSLYKINTLVDLINMVSIATGFSIGGFDEDMIEGDTLILDRGSKDDIFNAIGRGILNIDGLPVYRDLKGGIGTPTSDEERTKISLQTKKCLIIINSFCGDHNLGLAEDLMLTLLKLYVKANNINKVIV